MCIKGRLFMISLPTPMTHTTPPLRTAYVLRTTLLSTPVHSRTVDGAEYSSFPKSCLTAWAFCSDDNWRSTWYVIHPGTNSWANANLLGSRSVITSGWAPEARAAASAISPIGPAPQMSAGLPRLRPPVFTPWRTTLNGSSRAASAQEMLSGIL